MAQHASVATLEELTRLLGLTETQAESLVLPDRLPDLPAGPRSAEDVSKSASKERLDIQLARAELDAQAKAQGLNLVTSFTDIELGVRRDTVFDNAAGTSASRRGYEVSLRLPIFDLGDNQRDAMNAQTLAAANRLEAAVRAGGSNLRENPPRQGGADQIPVNRLPGPRWSICRARSQSVGNARLTPHKPAGHPCLIKLRAP